MKTQAYSGISIQGNITQKNRKNMQTENLINFKTFIFYVKGDKS